MRSCLWMCNNPAVMIRELFSFYFLMIFLSSVTSLIEEPDGK